MPRIPTLVSQGAPTAESSGIKTGFQVPLTGVGSPSATLEPVIKSLNDYYVKEQAVIEKTQALELENKASIELEETKSRLSKSADPLTSSDVFLQYSKQIKEKYANEAQSGSVKNLFINNYLAEEKKQLSSVVTKNRENLIQDRVNQADIKEQRILTTGLYSDNQLQKETMYSDLGILYQDLRKDFIIDEDTYQKKVRGIPSTIQTLEAKRDMNIDPINTALKLNNINNYPDVLGKQRAQLISEANSDARPALTDGMKNHLALVESGLPSKFDDKAIKPILGPQAYADFKEKESGVILFRDKSAEVFNAKIGTEQEVVNSYPVRPEAAAFDLEIKQKLANFASKKDEMLKKDPASIVMQFNPNVKDKYNDFQKETDPQIKDVNYKKYINSVIDAQKTLGLPDDRVKILPQQEAKRVVLDYNNQDVKGKIAYLQRLETIYGDNYGKLVTQLSESENGLPITAKLVSYLNDENFATQALSVDSKEKRDVIDRFMTTQTEETKKNIKSQVAEKLTDFRGVVMKSNPFNTSKANAELDNINDTIYYIAANKMSAGTPADKAVEEATNYINNGFYFKKDSTFFVPKFYNNQYVSSVQADFIKKKADIIKEYYLDQLDISSFGSNNKNIPQDLLNKEMKAQIKTNGMWLNNADGSGIVLGVKLSDGSIGLVPNKKGELIKINFDDVSHKIPNTNLKIDFKQTTTEELLKSIKSTAF
jgi:hypothetical protein